MHIIPEGTIVVNHNGLIEAVGPESDLNQQFANATFDVDIDATGKVVGPGTFDKDLLQRVLFSKLILYFVSSRRVGRWTYTSDMERR